MNRRGNKGLEKSNFCLQTLHLQGITEDYGGDGGISGSKITSGTVAAARIDNLTASMITSGVFDNSSIPKPANHITLFSGRLTTGEDGNFGGRNAADTICKNIMDSELINMFNNSCSNVRALI